MKNPLLAAFTLVLAVASAFAQQSFPGLKAVLSDAEWKRAGLDHLTPDQIGVIDAALIRREVALAAQHPAASAIASTSVAGTSPAGAPQGATGFWARFGLPAGKGVDWREVPPLKAKVVKWETPNRFVLDNGQAWESDETIIYDLVGKEVEIQARPMDRFALVVGEINTTNRVTRVR